MYGDSRQRRHGGQTGSAHLRPGRSGEAGRRDSPGRVGEEWWAIAWPTLAGEPAELTGWFPHYKAPSSPRGSCRHKKESGEIRWGRWEGPSQARGAGEERRAFAPPIRDQEACWAPRWCPCPLRPGVGAMPGPLLFLELKPHSPDPLGPFPALWVLSIGPAHCLNLTFA